ncbi:MAG: ABC transporter substrate-binding protein [Eubacteriales bacterium]
MKRKVLSIILSVSMIAGLLAGCGGSTTTESATTESTEEVATEEAVTEESSEEVTADFKGEELSILTSAGWMDSRYDETIARFEETYGVTVDLQSIPGDQYDDMLQSKLTSGTCTDIFWIQSNPFAIESVIVNPEEYCLDFTGAEWQSVIPEARLSSCMVGDTLYGLQLWHNSPEYVFVYNKTLFAELGIEEIPTTYDAFLAICDTVAAEGITPWYVPGADGWQHQLAFFQIGGVYEEATPGLYDALNNNTATYADNEKMLEVLEQYKELSDLGYLGEDWVGTDSTNMANAVADRDTAMVVANSSYIKQIQDETGTTDEFGLFLIPLGDNDTFPTNPAGPTMFGYSGATNPELVETFFEFVCTTESLQEILDNSPNYTNIAANDDAVVQNWLPEEEEFMATISEDKMATAVLQTGTKYSNDQWMSFGSDLVAYCQGTMEANDVLKNMDSYRAKSAEVMGDENWQ